ncbi:inner-membrane translocator [Cupriavidus necator N-1]|uniref:Inner-membrane translocator n=1 Tax=Cupriavidus necator (strain ATCC 43291 / DSM 13513 / CCUG 52238 / LMG 8453 / N-1) TaxID=1042878 RepID=G0ERV0_CUPNN|nr:ABC transporter permease [Cupriavidus necator]AEI75378.1 inner-membrane translocator [Cupriavidus necator N-1]MDX6012477.1 ABC transporter permease [Cupriavidus necator]
MNARLGRALTLGSLLSFPAAGHGRTVATLAAGTLVGLSVSALLLVAGGYPLGAALSSLWSGAFGGFAEGLDTLRDATPLFLVALATIVSYRAQLWNVGQEGQLVLGAIFCYGATLLAAGLPQPLPWLLPLCAGVAGGALWSTPPALARVRWGVNEIVSTMMFNYIAVFLLMYLVGHVWPESSATYLQTAPIGAPAHLPAWNAEGTLNAQFLIAAVVALALAVLFGRSVLGFEILSFGLNARTSAFKGIAAGATCLKVFAISGGIAGLCGAVMLLGTQWRLAPATLASGVGYSGIMVAMLGRLHPAGALLAALLFGALNTGSAAMQLEAGVPSTMARVMQAVLLISFLLAQAINQAQPAKRGRDA